MPGRTRSENRKQGRGNREGGREGVNSVLLVPLSSCHFSRSTSSILLVIASHTSLSNVALPSEEQEFSCYF